MPRVTRFGQRQVTPAPLPAARRRNAPTAASEGALVGEAVAQVGGQVGTIGLRQFAEVERREREQADDDAILKAKNHLSAWERKRLYDPDAGALGVRGEAAFELPEIVAGEFNQVAGDIEQGLKTDRQRQAFARLRGQAFANLDGTIRRHVQGEIDKNRVNELQATLQNAQTAAVQNAQDTRRVDQEMRFALTALATTGPRLGMGPEQLESAVNAFKSDTFEGIVNRLLANDQVAKASTYFEEVKEALSGDAIVRLEKALETGKVKVDATRRADVIIRAGGTLTEQREKAKAIADVETRQAALQLIEHEDAVQQRVAREREEADAQEATNLVEQRGFQAIPADLLARLSVGTRSSLRAYDRSRAAGVPVETNWPRFYELERQAADDPAAFLKHNLLSDRHQIGDVEWKHFTGLQRDIRNGDRAKVDKDLAGFRTKTEILENTLTQYGIDPKATPTSTEGKAIAQLQRMLDLRMDAAQARGQKVTNVEIQQTLDALLSTSVTVPGSWWNIFPGGKSFTDTQSRLIDLTVGDIPASERTLIEDALRAKGRPISDATVLDLYLEHRLRTGP